MESWWGIVLVGNRPEQESSGLELSSGELSWNQNAISNSRAHGIMSLTRFPAHGIMSLRHS